MTPDVWITAGQSGPFVAMFALLAFLCVTFLGSLVWIVKRNVEALDRIAETMGNMNVRLEHLETKLEAK